MDNLPSSSEPASPDRADSTRAHRWRPLLAAALLFLLGVLANLPYEYEELGRSSTQLPEFYDLCEEFTLQPGFTAAGWPMKYYVRSDVAGTEPISSFAWLPLLANIGCLLLVFGIALGYELLWKQRSQGKQTGITIADLMAVMVCLGLGLGYWRVLDARGKAAVALSKELERQQATVVRSVWLPKRVAPLVPSGLRPCFERISSVTLVSPTSEQLEQVVAIPMLRTLRIGGGDYSLELLEELSGKPLLWELRVSGRPLTPEAVATIASMKQLVMLNLMKTNITSQALHSLDSLTRLRQLYLVGTACRLADIGQPAWGDWIEVLTLPHPGPGMADEITIEGWPALRNLACVEVDKLRNDQPVRMVLRNLPQLTAVRLDLLQKFELTLENLPRFAYLQGDDTLCGNRVRNADEVPGEVWLSGLHVSRLGAVKKLAAYGPDLKALSFRDVPPLYFGIGTFYHNMPSPEPEEYYWAFDEEPEPVEPRTTLEVRQGWIDQLAASEGPDQVDLASVVMTDVDFSPLARNTGIRVLNLDDSFVTGRQLRSLAGCAGLERLTLKNCPVDGRAVEWLVDNLPALRELRCDQSRVERLRLGGHDALEKVFVDEGNEFEMAPIQDLRLRDMAMLQEEFELYYPLRRCELVNVPSLTGLCFHSRLPANAELSGFRDLKFFEAGGDRIDDQVFTELLACPNLERLTLAYAKVSPELLGRIGEFESLKELSLVGCQVTDGAVAQWGVLPRLQSLELDHTQITGRALTTIAEASGLKRLTLNHTELADADLTVLGNLEQLVELHLAGAPLSEALIAQFSNFPHLETLELSNTTLTGDLMAELAQRLPSGLSLLILRDIEAPQVSLGLLSGKVREFDITNSLFETASTDMLVQSERAIDIAEYDVRWRRSQQAMLAAQGYGSGVLESFSNRALDPAQFAPGAENYDAYGAFPAGFYDMPTMSEMMWQYVGYLWSRALLAGAGKGEEPEAELLLESELSF